MRLTISLMTACVMFLIAGCAPPPVVVASTEPLFCDIEEKRLFTQAELDWRSANAPWNLRRDFKTNAAFEEECEKGSKQ